MPNIPQCDIETRAVIRTNLFNEIPLRFHGIGGSVILKASVSIVEFGPCAVGSKQVIPITIKNEGISYSRFTTECTNKCFKADPEFGTIKNGESYIIKLYYIPEISKKINKGFFKLIPSNSSTKNVIIIPLIGISGSPDIVISKNLINFGYTLLRGKNVKALVIKNKGNVTGILDFKSKHPSISIEEADNTDRIVIEPKSKKKIHFVYIPVRMEMLNTYGVFSYLNYKSDNILINFKAVVCQPKLTIEPPDFYNILDFGICHVNKTYEKTFTISNEGTIDLKYSIKFDYEKISNSDNGNDSDDMDSDDTNSDNEDLINKDNEKMKELLHDGNETIVNIVEDTVKNSQNEEERESIDCPFTFINNENNLPMGKKVLVTLKFQPKTNKKYTFNYSLYYGFQPICGSAIGIGGIGKINFFPKVNFINFGLCRINKETVKKVYVKNLGNITEKFIIRPVLPDIPLDELYKKDIESLNDFEQSEYFEEETSNRMKKQKDIQTSENPKINLWQWESYLENNGLKLLNYDGICKPNEEKAIDFIYNPSKNEALNTSFILYTKWKKNEIHIVGKSGKSELKLYDINDQEISIKKGIKFGMKSVNTLNKINIKIKNIGDFGVDFMINKSIKSIFEVHPETGFIPPNSSLVLTISYLPKEENVFKWILNIIWSDGIISVPVSAKSGTGNLDIVFPDSFDGNMTVTKEKNKNENNSYIMNFSPIPLESYTIKKFFIYNNGIVSVDTEFKVTGDSFLIAISSDLLKFNINSVGGAEIDKKNSPSISKPEWNKELKVNIPPRYYVEISCRYYAKSEFISKEKIFINSSCFYGKITVIARGGNIELSHTGTLDFNDINAKYSYSKNITLRNTGSIDTKLSFKWTMSSHKHYKIVTPGKINFINLYDNDDPRSEIFKNYLIVKSKITSNSKEIQMQLLNENKMYSDFSKNTKYYWELIRLNILPKYFDYDSNKLIQYIEKLENVNIFKNFINNFKKTIDLIEKYRFKRKKNLYKLIETKPITSQSLSNIQSYMRVIPEECTLKANQSMSLHVDLNLEHEMDYIATLHCISNFSSVNEYLIPLIATPKQIYVLCDMNKIDFKTQAIGETDVITKEFTNVGSKDISFTIDSNNEGLKIIPNEGILAKGETITVKFIFQPVSEHIQTFPILFKPENSQPIRLQFYGAGGYAQMSLKNGSTYEFGNCVIGKKLDVYLPIENKGTAVLKINSVILYSSGSFTEGPNWPVDRVNIQPKTIYKLPLIFKPDNEQPPPATVSIITPLENYEINITGVGKDAMIIISNLYLEFNDCIIGNQYEQQVSFRNTGDVNYQIKMELKDLIPGIKFIPDNFTIPPYSTYEVTIQFKPTVEINKDIFVDVNSPYSKNQIRLKIHSGYVKLLIEKDIFDYGMFETNSVPKIKFDIKNVGSIGTHYSIVHRNSDSNIQFSNKTGFIRPNDFTTVKMFYISNNKQFGPFVEVFDILYDLINSSVPFKVIGDCNHALIHPQEINSVDLGLCPIFEHTKKSITLKNYGKFPLTYKIKVVYPILCNVIKGVLNGNESQVIKFSWMPTGGYVLHSTATLSSNAGNYPISITGRGTLPKINISSEKIDYGICALNCTYEKILTIKNVGLVKFKWSVQQQNQDFILSNKDGELNVNESVDIKINFTPRNLKCYQSILYLECKGLTSREIQLVGVGGNMKFYISPRVVDMGNFFFLALFLIFINIYLLLYKYIYKFLIVRFFLLIINKFFIEIPHIFLIKKKGVCSKGLLTTGSFTIRSKGEVTIYSDFSEGKKLKPNNMLFVPKSIVLPPGNSHKCKFDIIPYDEGPFEYRLIISTKEKIYRIKIKGN